MKYLAIIIAIIPTLLIVNVARFISKQPKQPPVTRRVYVYSTQMLEIGKTDKSHGVLEKPTGNTIAVPVDLPEGATEYSEGGDFDPNTGLFTPTRIVPAPPQKYVDNPASHFPLRLLRNCGIIYAVAVAVFISGPLLRLLRRVYKRRKNEAFPKRGFAVLPINPLPVSVIPPRPVRPGQPHERAIR